MIIKRRELLSRDRQGRVSRESVFFFFSSRPYRHPSVLQEYNCRRANLYVESFISQLFTRLCYVVSHWDNIHLYYKPILISCTLIHFCEMTFYFINFSVVYWSKISGWRKYRHRTIGRGKRLEKVIFLVVYV